MSGQAHLQHIPWGKPQVTQEAAPAHSFLVQTQVCQVGCGGGPTA